MTDNFRKMGVIYTPDSDGPAKETRWWAVPYRFIDEATVRQHNPLIMRSLAYPASFAGRMAFIGVN